MNQWHDDCVALLGQQVEVVLARVGDPTGPWGWDVTDGPRRASDEVARGVLLGFGDGGDLEILEDDGMTHHCWPNLEVRARSDVTADGAEMLVWVNRQHLRTG